MKTRDLNNQELKTIDGGNSSNGNDNTSVGVHASFQITARTRDEDGEYREVSAGDSISAEFSTED